MVSNVRFQQRVDGSLQVDIFYDLSDQDGDSLLVKVLASKDGGATWDLACKALTGDVGLKLASGKNKHILWDFFQDNPQTSGSQYVIQIVADDMKTLDIQWITIPSGPFTYGSNNQTQDLNYAFDIMKYPVTNAQYLKFLNSALASGKITVSGNEVQGYYSGDAVWPARKYTFYSLRSYADYHMGYFAFDGKTFRLLPDSTYANHPVAAITWFGAYGFAEYYQLRLPTEEEWEKAARGNTGRAYPWGNLISGSRANYLNSGDPFDNGTTPAGYYNGSNYNGFQTVNSPSPYGVYDMAGNVWQSTNSFFGEDSPLERVFRGGAWTMSVTEALLTYYRTSYNPENRNIGLGFRCAKSK